METNCQNPRTIPKSVVTMNDPIDIVLLWVDGDDPAHKQKMKPYLEALGHVSEDISGPTRFRNVGEIFYCVASILRFAPYIRKIFIVTDNQNPNLDNFLNENFPERKTEIEIIDHAVIFRGYEEYLPIFNCNSIEVCMSRIPGLSENFIYFNDDLFIAKPTCPEDFFRDGKIVCSGNWRNLIVDSAVSRLKNMIYGDKVLGFKDFMMASARILGRKSHYFYLTHVPHPQKKSVLEKFFAEHPDEFTKNLAHRFRNKRQFNPQALCYTLALESGQCVLTKRDELYMKPVGRGKGYVERKIREFKKHNPKFMCVGSLDMAAEEDRTAIKEWLKGVLNITVPASIQNY